MVILSLCLISLPADLISVVLFVCSAVSFLQMKYKQGFCQMHANRKVSANRKERKILAVESSRAVSSKWELLLNSQ